MTELRRLASLLSQRERWRAGRLTLLALLSAFVEALGIGAVFPLLSLLTQPGEMLARSSVRAAYVWSGAASYEQFVLFATAALMLVFVGKNLFLGAFYRMQARFVANVESRMGTDLLAAYLYAPYVERAEQNSADRIRVITTEVSRVSNGYLLPLVAMSAEALVVILLLALLLVVQPQSALLALVLMGTVAALVQAGIRRKLNAQREIRVTASSSMYRAVSEGLGALKETKVLGREQHFVQRYQQNSERYANATTIFTTMNLVPRLIVETAAVAALAGCIMLTILTQSPLPGIVPVLTVFGLAAVRMMPSVTRIMSGANNLRYYTPSVQQVAEHVLSARGLRRDVSLIPARAPVAVNEIELRSVSYTYPGATSPTLQDVNLRVSRGAIVALSGRSGSGKTTLGDILLGLLVPTTGQIAVNGRAVREPRRELGSFAGLVPQNFFILDDSVRRNVAFGVPDSAIDDDKVWKALALAHLAERVGDEARGLDMQTGEDGAFLSGGERQRLCIARALYHDPGLLVFDEATSALDGATEAEIVRTIQDVAATKAVLVIAHRPALLQAASRVFVLEDGRLTQTSGSRADTTIPT